MTASGISEEDLHALVDGRLATAEAAMIERRIRADRDTVDRIALWRRQSTGLAAAFAPIAEEPVPIEFLGRSADLAPMHRLGWLAMGFAVGVVLGIMVGIHIGGPGIL